MKRVLCVALLCLLLAGFLGCGQQEAEEEAATPETVTEETTGAMALSENAWGVTIERIDLEKPENQKYIDWAKKDQADNSWAKGPPDTLTYKIPEYFGVMPYLKQAEDGPGPWNWNETKELVFQNTYTGREEGDTAFLVRDKATGETERIDGGYFCDSYGVVFDTIVILSDTRILYHKWDWDNVPDEYYLYDLEIGERICVWSKLNILCDLGNDQYLWCDSWNTDIRALYLIDARALETGDKEARRTLVSWGSNSDGSICHLSSDKRFVYMELSGQSDHTDQRRTDHRGVYDIETGELVALIELPYYFDNKVLISDDLEYLYRYSGIIEDPEIEDFYIIHYNRTGGLS